MKNNKKTMILSVVAIVTFAILIVGATYAYFQAQTGAGKSTDINVTTYTTDVFTFATGDAISLEADQTTFGKDKGSVNGTTYASALLTANNKNNNAVEHYYLYLNIENNTFTYSVQDNKPELIMTITDKEENEVKNIEGLTYTEVTDRTNKKISGYDITTKSGLVTIFNNREIIAEPKAEDKWNITITFVNYDENQNGNAGKSMSAKVMIQKEKINLLADYVKSLYTGTQGENSIYYHDSSLTNGAGDNSYRYAGGSDSCTFNGENVVGAYSDLTFGASNETDCQKVYTIKSDGITRRTDNSITRLLSDEKPVTWTDGACKTMDGESVNFGFVGGNFKSVTEATCKGNSYLVKTDEFKARVANLNMEYVGVGTWNSVNNFVCFGTNTTPCPTDNLYRIIGVFGNNVKLIKYDYANSNLLGTDGDYQDSTTPNASYYKGNLITIDIYNWNYTANNAASNTWSTSLFNKTNLNTNYLNKIGTTWSNLIEDTTWKVSGHTTNAVIPKAMYTAEISNATKTYGPENGTSKIGLMYVSDYGFAASPRYWITTLSNYNESVNRNWMYMGLAEWTITPDSSDSDGVFYLGSNGNLSTDFASNGYGARPVLYLKASVAYAGGSGTQSDPIIGD